MSNLEQLHEQDLNLWLEKVTQKIKNRDFTDMDWNNLVEEIEDMSASQKRALRSYYSRLIEHLLKIKYWESEKARNETKWRIEIDNFRREIQSILEDSPSLKNYLAKNYLDWQNKVIKNYQKNQLFPVPKNIMMSLEETMQD